MAEIVSALAGHLTAGRYGAGRKGAGVVFREVLGRDLVQVGVWRETLGSVRQRLTTELGLAMPADTRRAVQGPEITVFMVAPDKLWITAPLAANVLQRVSDVVPMAEGVVTELGHSRTVLRVAGASARDLLCRHFALDFHPGAFPAGNFASSSMHHVGTMVHYVRDLAGDPVYDLYLPRTFALSLYEGLAHTAEPFGYAIEA